MLPHGPTYPHSGKSGANYLPGALPVSRRDFCPCLFGKVVCHSRQVQEHSCLRPLFPHKRPSFPRGDMDRWDILRALVGDGKGLPIMSLSWSQQFLCNQPTKGLFCGFPRVLGPKRGSLKDPDPAMVAQAWISSPWPSEPHLVQSLSHLHDQIPDKKEP